jgi:hypothetical protein
MDELKDIDTKNLDLDLSEPEKIQPEVKLIKLKNGESLIAMIEWDTDINDSDIITLYNPFKLVFGDITMNQRTPVLMEEWLPTQIVQEQVCTIYSEDVLTVIDVNEKFAKSYSRTVIKKVQMEEMIRKGNFLKDRVAESLALADEESDESENDDLEAKLAEALNEFRRKYN